MLAGKWTYRSYRNETGLVGGDAAAALALVFGEGVFDFAADGPGRVTGALGMGADYALTLKGGYTPGDDDVPPQFAIEGFGIDGTPTAGWRYEYRGVLGYRWPDGIDQVPAMLGTVIRVVAHGPGAPAGTVASFMAVRHSENPPPRTRRRSTLTAGL